MNINSSYITVIKSGPTEYNIEKTLADVDDFKTNDKDKSISPLREPLKQSVHYPETNCTTIFPKYLNGHTYSTHLEKIKDQSVDGELNNEIKENNSNFQAATCDEEKIFICDKCPFTTKFVYGFKIHQRNHSLKYKFNCTECSYKSNVEYYLKIHQLNHTGEYSFLCTKCEYKTNWKDVFQSHQRSHSEEKIFECEGCKFKFNNEEDYQNHRCTCFGDYELHCANCHFRTNKWHTFQTHKLYHNSDVIIFCNICLYKTNDKELFKIHSSIHSERYKFQCAKCNFRTLCPKKFNKHKLCNHTGECDDGKVWYQFFRKPNFTHFGTFKCDHCHFNTTDIYSFKIHHCNNSKSSFQYNCSECDFKTNRKIYFQQHQNDHEEDKAANKFHAETFIDANNFDKKIKITSTTVKKHFCCKECDYNTLFKSDLIKHKRIHFTEDLNVLHPNENIQLDFSECEKRDVGLEVSENFKIVNCILDREHNNLNSLQMQQCDTCNYQAKTLYLLILHEAQHTDEITFHCCYCPYYNKSRCDLITHQKYCIYRTK